MNLKDLLVYIDLSSTCSTRLATAIQLAQQQQAKLTGIYTIPPHRANDFEQPYKLADQAKLKFQQTVEQAGLESEWICADSSRNNLDLVQSINLYAHYRDMLIVSQADHDATQQLTPGELPEKAVLGAGRPVLIVPYTCDTRTIGKRVMLVWRGGPESSRAMHDSMPLLRAADSDYKGVNHCIGASVESAAAAGAAGDARMGHGGGNGGSGVGAFSPTADHTSGSRDAPSQVH